MTDPLNPANPGNPNNPVRSRRQGEARPRDERTLVRVRDALGRLEAWARSEGWSDEALSLLTLGIAEANQDGEVAGLRSALRDARDVKRAADAAAVVAEREAAVRDALRNERARVAVETNRSLFSGYPSSPPETPEQQAARVEANRLQAAKVDKDRRVLARWREAERVLRLLIADFQSGGEARGHINSLSRMIQNVPHFPAASARSQLARSQLVAACKELHEQMGAARRAEHKERFEAEVIAAEALIEPLRAAILVYDGRRPVDPAMAQYLAECCDQGPMKGPTTFRDLYKSYEAWSLHAGAEPNAEVWFGKQLNFAGIEENPGHGAAKQRRGIGLKVRAP